MDMRDKLFATKRKVNNVQIEDSGVKCIVRFQNFDPKKFWNLTKHFFPGYL